MLDSKISLVPTGSSDGMVFVSLSSLKSMYSAAAVDLIVSDFRYISLMYFPKALWRYLWHFKLLCVSKIRRAYREQ